MDTRGGDATGAKFILKGPRCGHFGNGWYSILRKLRRFPFPVSGLIPFRSSPPPLTSYTFLAPPASAFFAVFFVALRCATHGAKSPLSEFASNSAQAETSCRSNSVSFASPPNPSSNSPRALANAGNLSEGEGAQSPRAREERKYRETDPQSASAAQPLGGESRNVPGVWPKFGRFA